MWEQLRGVVLALSLARGCSQNVGRGRDRLQAHLGLEKPLPGWRPHVAGSRGPLFLTTWMLECPHNMAASSPQG